MDLAAWVRVFSLLTAAFSLPSNGISVDQAYSRIPGRGSIEERAALEELYNSAGGHGWRRSDGWMTAMDLCDWFGVQCDNSTASEPAHIRSFSLYDNLLEGTIPEALSALSHVEYFALSTNKLSGTLPATLTANFSYVKYFDLRYNLISGSIPTSVGFMTSLNHLVLSNNAFQGANLPIDRMSKLAYLDISANQLTASVPGVVCHWKNLTYCALNGKYHTNRFTNIPTCATLPPTNCIT
eukprot:TRINITY_DN4753_c0_g1_i1.p1 TRINITY_DN4753_c0_g1~~TRINITY_DN4753_c0_g1_i1.p1  ORF type:complete len:239 (+),score=40.66 TRINITY_DN4753_c0_g1_i1:214-930(+)